MKNKKITVTFTQSELKAIFQTAGNIEDDLNYFNYLEKKEFKLFCDSYYSAMRKIKNLLGGKKSLVL